MITPRASFHPLLSSFFNNFRHSEDNLIHDCEAEVSFPALGLVGLLDAEHPRPPRSARLRSAPRGLPTHTMYDGQQRRQQ